MKRYRPSSCVLITLILSLAPEAAVQGEDALSQDPGKFNKQLTKQAGKVSQAVKNQQKKVTQGQIWIPGAVVQEVRGATGLYIRDEKGKARPIAAGQELMEGDSFQTVEKTAVRIAIDQNTQVIITSGTQVRIGTRKSEDEPPAIELQKGKLRTVVQKAAEKIKKREKKFKFVIRTRSATLGVRGTDFFVEADLARTVVQTVSGTVEVAKDWSKLRRGHGIKVPAGKETRALDGNNEIRKPLSFNVARVVAAFEESGPGVEGMWKKASSDVKNGDYRKRMEEMSGKARKWLRYRRLRMEEARKADSMTKMGTRSGKMITVNGVGTIPARFLEAPSVKKAIASGDPAAVKKALIKLKKKWRRRAKRRSKSKRNSRSKGDAFGDDQGSGVPDGVNPGEAGKDAFKGKAFHKKKRRHRRRRHRKAKKKGKNKNKIKSMF